MSSFIAMHETQKRGARFLLDSRARETERESLCEQQGVTPIGSDPIDQAADAPSLVIIQRS